MHSTIGFESLELELEFGSEFPEGPRLGGGLPSLGTSWLVTIDLWWLELE